MIRGLSRLALLLVGGGMGFSVLLLSSCPRTGAGVPRERRVVKLTDKKKVTLPGYEIMSFQPERLPVLMGLTADKLSLIAKPAIKLFEIYTATIGEKQQRPSIGERFIKTAPTNRGDQYAQNGYALDYALFMERKEKLGSYELVLLPMEGFSQPSISLAEFMVPDQSMGQHYLISYGGEYLFALASIPLEKPPAANSEDSPGEKQVQPPQESNGGNEESEELTAPDGKASKSGSLEESSPTTPSQGAPEKGGQLIGPYLLNKFKLLYKVIKINHDEEGGLSLELLRSMEIELPPNAGLGLLAQASAARNGVVVAFYKEEAQNYQVKGTVLARLDLEGNLDILAESDESPALLLAGEKTDSALLLTSGEEAVSTQEGLGGRGEESLLPAVSLYRYLEGKGLVKLADLPAPSVPTIAYQKDLTRIFYPSIEKGLIELIWGGEKYQEKSFPHIVTYAPLYWHPGYHALIMELGNAYVMFPERELERYDQFLADRIEERWNQLQSSFEQMGLAKLEEGKYRLALEDWRVPPARDWENLLLIPKEPNNPGELYSPAKFSFYRDESRWFNFTAGFLLGDLLGDFEGGFGDGEQTEQAAKQVIEHLSRAWGFDPASLELVYSRGLGKEKDEQRLWFCRMREVQGYEVCDLRIYFLFAPLSAKLFQVQVDELPIPDDFDILLDEKTARRFMIRFGENYFHRPTNVNLEWVMLMGHYPSYDPVLKVPVHPNLEQPNISWHFRMVGVDRDFYIDARTGLVN